MKINLKSLFTGTSNSAFIVCDTNSKLRELENYLIGLGYGTNLTRNIDHTVIFIGDTIGPTSYSTYTQDYSRKNWYSSYPFYNIEDILEEEYDINIIESNLDKLIIKIKEDV